MTQAPNDTPTLSASAQKHKTLARAIIANDIDACREMYGVLKASGKSLSEDDVQALGMRWFTNKARPVEMVPFLHEIGFDFLQYVVLDQEKENTGTRIPFRLIGNEKNELVLRKLIDIKVVPLDLTDGMGDNLLVAALQWKRYDLASELKGLGVDVNATNLAGQTALHVAAAALDFSAVQWLGSNGADPQIEDIQGARASEMVPEVMDGWDPNAMFDVLEGYVERFRLGQSIEMTAEYEAMVQKEKPKTNDENDGQTVGDQANEAKSILSGLGM